MSSRSFWIVALVATFTLRAGDPVPAFRPGTRVVFQGDSITDGGRGRTLDPNHVLGQDYAYLIAARYGAMLPERNLVFLNRGRSGDKVADMVLRWQSDTLELKPNILSILIGINDTSHGVPLEDFEKQYDKLLADTIKALPNLRIVLGEPFTLPVGKRKENWEEWRAQVHARQDVVRKLSFKYQTALVHYQRLFEDACQRAPAEYWIWDGIHPTYSGHQLMADEWIRTVNEFWPK